MKVFKRVLTVVMVLIGVVLLTGGFRQAPAPSQELIVCGWDEVFILDLAAQGEPRKVWSWRTNDSPELPDQIRGLFKTTDECKPVDNGRKLLISSSGGCVALVDRATKRALFYGRAANAHSADLLPGARVAVAASHDPQGRGDRLILFDTSLPDQPLWEGPLTWGHGVVWDDERQRLWALADTELRIYRLQDWKTAKPRLDLESTIPLPEAMGHDLYPIAGTSLLTLTTTKHAYLFDRDKRTLVLHPTLGNLEDVKSISMHPVTRQLVYVQAEGEHWWAERLHFLNPDKTLYTPGEHFYKARWNVAGQ